MSRLLRSLRGARRRLLAAVATAACLGGWACGGHGPATPSEPSSPLAAEGPFQVERLIDPPRSYGPWVRWWWPGNDVDDTELAREVGALADAGFAGAEIQAFDAALDPQAPKDEIDRRRSYGTPAFYSHLAAVADAALAKGVAIDLTLGSGWPVGGDHVTPGKSLQTMLWSENAVTGPAAVALDLSHPDKPIFYLVAQILQLAGEPEARWEGDLAQRIAVLAGRVTGGGRSSNPLDLADAIEIDPTSLVDLTAKVGTDGMLHWQAPEGRWQVMAFFTAPDGEYPLLNAEPEPGFVVDHLDAPTVRAEAELRFGAATGLTLGTASPFRALFDDSLELKAERHVTHDFLAEFQRRRGYDPRPWLPAVVVPGADNYVFEAAAIQAGPPFVFGPDDARVRYDWSKTVSDLFVDRWYGTLRDWSHEHGLALRAQPYGAAFDVLRAEGTADVPETEQLYAGGAQMSLAMAASAAALYGRNLVSAETMPWASRDAMTTPAKMKLAADKLFAAGINEVVFHGFPYRKDGSHGEYGETGWNPFSSPWSGLLTFASQVGEKDPFWPDQPALDRYLARCQYALRQGAPDIDVLVYYPWLGFPSNFQFMDQHQETLFKGGVPGLEPDVGFDQLYAIGRAIGVSGTDPRAAWLEQLWPFFEDLTQRGFTWAWVNDESLAVAAAKQGAIQIRGRSYRGVAVANAAAMDPDAAQAVAALASAGIPEVFVGDLPAKQPGYANRQRGDAAVSDSIVRAAAAPHSARVAGASDGASGFETAGLRSPFAVTPEHTPVQQARRVLSDGGELVFLWNPTREAVTATVVPVSCSTPHWFDPWTGSISATASLDLSLAPWETRFLLCGLDVSDAPPADGTSPISAGGTSGARSPILGWHLDVAGPDVASGAFAGDVGGSPDWRTIPGLEHASSDGRYSATVTIDPLAPAERLVLSLGWVVGVADVLVNGTPAGRVRFPPFELDITGLVKPGQNQLEVDVVSPRRNRYIGYGVAGDPAYAQWAGRPDDLMATGIPGSPTLDRRTGTQTESPSE